MLEIMKYLKARYMSEKAQGMTEYAVILGLIVIIAIAVFQSNGTLSTNLQLIFTNISDKLKTIADGVSGAK